MSRKKEEHEKEPNHERWLVSYADFITLLFAVFVVLYAMSQVDKARVAKVIASTNDAFGISKSPAAPAFSVLDTASLIPMPSKQKSAPDPGLTEEQKQKYKNKSKQTDLVDEAFKTPVITPRVEKKGKIAGQEEKSTAKALTSTADTHPPQPPEKIRADTEEFKKIKEDITTFLQEKGAEDQIKMVIGPRGLIISLKDTEFFDSGKATVRPESMHLLDNISDAIGKYSNSIRIEGHTDNIPIKTSAFPSNWELSTARATNIVHYLVTSRPILPDRLSAIGYGEYRPVADNNTEEGRLKNRRVDIVLLSSAGEQGEAAREPQPEQ